MPSARTPIGLVAVFASGQGWRASVQQGEQLRTTRISYASPGAALLAVSGVPADTAWLVELAATADRDRA